MIRLAVAANNVAAATIGDASRVEAQSKTKSAVRECKTKSADGKLHKWKCNDRTTLLLQCRDRFAGRPSLVVCDHYRLSFVSGYAHCVQIRPRAV